MADNLLSVIIPVKDEAATLEQMIAMVVAVDVPGMDKEVILVDDGSSDATAEILARHSDREGFVVLHHEVNQGKGAAIRTALGHATGSIVLIQDADLEVVPSEYPRLVEPIRSGRTRVVYGSRFMGSKPGMSLANYVGNRSLSFLASAMGPSRITDEATCFKVFDAQFLKSLPLKCRRFEFCPEVTGFLQAMKEPIVEVAVDYVARNREEGKKVRASDGLVALVWLLQSRYGRRADKRDAGLITR